MNDLGDRLMQKMPELSLSSFRLERSASLLRQDEFTFIVGKEARHYDCPLIQACFISERVCRSIKILPNVTMPPFDIIENLMNGRSVDLQDRDFEQAYELACELENDELCSRIVAFEGRRGPLATTNCLFRLLAKIRNPMPGVDTQEEISFIAANFASVASEITNSKYLRVSDVVSILEEVLNNKSLVLDSEHALLDFISNMSEKDSSYSMLLKYVYFEYLPSEDVARFFSLVYPDYVDKNLWDRMIEYIGDHVKAHERENYVDVSILSYHGKYMSPKLRPDCTAVRPEKITMCKMGDKTVAFRAMVGGKQMYMTSSSSGSVSWTENLGESEKFKCEHTFQSCKHQFFLCADGDNLKCDRNRSGAWERFTVKRIDQPKTPTGRRYKCKL